MTHPATWWRSSSPQLQPDRRRARGRAGTRGSAWPIWERSFRLRPLVGRSRRRCDSAARDPGLEHRRPGAARPRRPGCEHGAGGGRAARARRASPAAGRRHCLGRPRTVAADGECVRRVLLDGKDLAEGEASVRPHRWVDVAISSRARCRTLSNPVRTMTAPMRGGAELHGLAQGSTARARAGDLRSVGSRRPGRSGFPTSSRAGCASARRSPWPSRAIRGC